MLITAAINTIRINNLVICATVPPTTWIKDKLLAEGSSIFPNTIEPPNTDEFLFLLN